MKCDFCSEKSSFRYEGCSYCKRCLLKTLIQRFFDSRELIEEYFQFYYPAATPYMINSFSTNELINQFNDENIEDIIDYLRINAYKIDE